STRTSPLRTAALLTPPLSPCGYIAQSKRLRFILEDEKNYLIEGDYLTLNQSLLTEQTRREMVKLIERVSANPIFSYKPDTVALAVNLMDRYLCLIRIYRRNHFPLIALSALYIAAKLVEETNEPRARRICRVVNGELDDFLCQGKRLEVTEK